VRVGAEGNPVWIPDAPRGHTACVMEAGGLEELIRRAREGEGEAIGELSQRYGNRVRGAIRRGLAPDLRARVDTDDVFQSTFAASLHALKGFRYEGEKAFVAWLTKMAERRLIDAARRHRAEMRDVRRQLPLASAAARSAGLTSPTQGVARSEVTESIQRAVSRLPDSERRIVEMRSYENRSFLEIAEEVGLSGKDAARDAYRRALKRMGDFVGSDGAPRGQTDG